MPLYPIYYDTETTGIRSDKDRIVEIAAFDPTSNRTFCHFVNPGIPIPPEATSIHNISNEMVSNSPSFQEIGQAFIDFCGPDAVLIAHNNDAFDRHFLQNECKRHGLSLPSWAQLDSLKWARKYRPDLPRHTLQFLREIYEIPSNQAHRALDDVIVLHQVFSQMTDNLSIETILSLLSSRLPACHLANTKELPYLKFPSHMSNGLFNQELSTSQKIKISTTALKN